MTQSYNEIHKCVLKSSVFYSDIIVILLYLKHNIQHFQFGYIVGYFVISNFCLKHEKFYYGHQMLKGKEDCTLLLYDQKQFCAKMKFLFPFLLICSFNIQSVNIQFCVIFPIVKMTFCPLLRMPNVHDIVKHI